jgi:class 3 adenylate cyclase
MSMLFADIRGSTPLAEGMSASEFKRLIDRFYSETTHVLSHSLAFIDKLAGDEVSGFYLPGFVGRNYARKSVEAAREILQVTGHDGVRGPWAPVGVGVNTGEAYFGTVGEDDDLIEMTEREERASRCLGDDTGARNRSPALIPQDSVVTEPRFLGSLRRI